MPWDCSKCGDEFYYDDEKDEAQEARGEIDTEAYSCNKCDFALCATCYDKSIIENHNTLKHAMN
jgi:hypothetical protein